MYRDRFQDVLQEQYEAQKPSTPAARLAIWKETAQKCLEQEDPDIKATIIAELEELAKARSEEESDGPRTPRQYQEYVFTHPLFS